MAATETDQTIRRFTEARETALLALEIVADAEAILARIPRIRLLSPAAKALLPPNSPHTLESILRRACVEKPQTVADMVADTLDARAALLELTPCSCLWKTYRRLCPHDPMARTLYLVVREAVLQCEDVLEHYAGMDTNSLISYRTLPPCAIYEDDIEDEILHTMSDRYWDAEYKIARMHRASHRPLTPGFSSECVGMLCHAYEAEGPSPIGLNLFKVEE